MVHLWTDCFIYAYLICLVDTNVCSCYCYVPTGCYMCLIGTQVKVHCRPTAAQLLQLDIMKL